MTPQDRLDAYRKKRDAARTPEPFGGSAPATGRLFVLHKHHARNLHWEPAQGSKLHAVSLADGSVRSWNIPPMMCFHAAQAYAEGDDLVVELCEFDDARIIDDLRLKFPDVPGLDEDILAFIEVAHAQFWLQLNA